MPTMFSFSQYQAFLTCPKKYYWAYERQLVPREPSKALIQGNSFHDGVAGKPGTGLYHAIGVLASRYFQAMPGQQNEVERVADFGEFQIRCIADAVSDEHVIEYKTMTRPDADAINAQLLSAQLRLYAIAFGKPKALIRIARKTELRQRKGETDEQFEARILYEYIQSPAEYFLELEVSVGKSGTIAEMLAVYKQIQTAVSSQIWPCNAPYACYGRYPCNYLPLCVDEPTNLILYESRTEREASNVAI